MAEVHEPQRIEPTKLGDYLEVMAKAVFQSGISWRVVESKWPGIREAFQGFDAARVAAIQLLEVNELVTDTRVPI
jgi:3-methyladenine DNA glycosylase Tag